MSLEPAATYKLLKPSMSDIVDRIILPILSFNDKDAAMWRDRPEEVVKRNADIMFIISNNPESRAIDFVKDLMRVRVVYRPQPCAVAAIVSNIDVLDISSHVFGSGLLSIGVETI